MQRHRKTASPPLGNFKNINVDQRATQPHNGDSLKNVSSTPANYCEAGFFAPYSGVAHQCAALSVMGVSGSGNAPAALTCRESTPTLSGGFLNLKNVRRAHHAC